MKRLYPNHIERRGHGAPSVAGANRSTDKAISFIAFLLLVFLINWLVGCQTAEPVQRVVASPNCKEKPVDFRCIPYYPEPEIEYDNFEVIE